MNIIELTTKIRNGKPRIYEDVFGIGTALSGIVNAGVSGHTSQKNYELQKEYAEKNYQFQREQFEYQKELNEIQRQREDTAVQRQMADYKAAGINPLTAAETGGASTSGGSSTSFSGVDAPQKEQVDYSKIIPDIEGIASTVQSLIQQKQDINNTKAQEDLTKQEILNKQEEVLNLQSDTASKKAMEAKIRQEMKSIIQKRNIEISDWYKSERRGLRSWDREGSILGVDMGTIGTLMSNIENNLAQGYNWLLDKYKQLRGKKDNIEEYNERKAKEKNLWDNYPMP